MPINSRDFKAALRTTVLTEPTQELLMTGIIYMVVTDFM